MQTNTVKIGMHVILLYFKLDQAPLIKDELELLFPDETDEQLYYGPVLRTGRGTSSFRIIFADELLPTATYIKLKFSEYEEI